MKNLTLMLISGCVLVATGWMLFQIEDSPYQKMQSSSNSNGVTASLAMSVREAGHASYGHHVILHGFDRYGAFEDGYIAFAGYCTDAQIKWKDDDLLLYTCSNMKDARTEASLVNGMAIRRVEFLNLE